ncbi:Hypp6332 [Branchiostoma lanceolatum]|uniref:Hypp6332 protein n=1 Tax=Branchiostoma lanceolatum TaxID=7740 RepID=A0A8J9YT30_BRALA|nr:Hypp6332 [Branchiostoma lanceolatum]
MANNTTLAFNATTALQTTPLPMTTSSISAVTDMAGSIGPLDVAAIACGLFIFISLCVVTALSMKRRKKAAKKARFLAASQAKMREESTVQIAGSTDTLSSVYTVEESGK